MAVPIVMQPGLGLVPPQVVFNENVAINEVAMFRETYQAAKIRIMVDGHVRLSELICDGVLVATPAGRWTRSTWAAARRHSCPTGS